MRAPDIRTKTPLLLTHLKSLLIGLLISQNATAFMFAA